MHYQQRNFLILVIYFYSIILMSSLQKIQKDLEKSYFMKKAMYLIATHDMIFDDFVLKTIYFTYTCTLKYHQ